jgi:L-ascorbate metabolism protein UlaG (beta-lactamase superfamily)
LKRKTKISVSRRQFISAGFLGAAGYWAGCSNEFGARMLRGVVAESGRRVASPKHTPHPKSWSDNAITAAWLGHSTVLLNFYGVRILTDPVLFKRVGVNLKLGTVGPKRLIAPALGINQLPSIDLVLLSHAHMDHLDLTTLRCFTNATKAVTAHATADLLAGTRLKQVEELGWDKQTKVHTRHGDLVLRAFQVNHWGARWRRDKHRGYTGYVLEREGRKIIFGGDTAWSDSFKALSNRGPYELAIMPIGAYKPWICSHCTPEQALRMANEAGANYFLPIHHRTFAFGREARHEPLQRLEAAIEKERLALREVGETFRVS